MKRRLKLVAILSTLCMAVSLGITAVFAASLGGLGVNSKVRYEKDFYPLELVLGDGAVWTPQTTVPEEYPYSAPFDLPEENSAYKVGYTLSSWNTKQDGTGETVSTIQSGVSGPQTYYAQWTEDTYSITYFQSENDENPTSSSYNINSQDITLQIPQKTGNTFVGWLESISINSNDYFSGYINNSGSYEKNETYPNSIFTKAIFVQSGKQYSILAQTGTSMSMFAYATDGEFAGKIMISGTEIPFTGYSLYGFETSQDCYVQVLFDQGITDGQKSEFMIVSDGITTIKHGSTGNRSYLANWEANDFAITYEGLDGATNHQSNPTIFTFSENDQTLTILDPTKQYYEFAGWETSQGASIDGTTLTIAGGTTSVTLTATWTAKTYEILYELGEEAQNGENNPTSYTYNGEEQTFTLNKPTRAGYNFVSWQVQNGVIDGTNLIVTAEDVVLTAVWSQAEVYSISYKLDGGRNHSGNPSGYTIETETFTLQDPIKEGYIFLGWTGTEIAEPTKEVTITKGSTGNREYIAHWKIQTFTVTIVSNNTEYGTVDVSEVLEVPYGTQIIESENTISINGTLVTAAPTPMNNYNQYAFEFWDYDRAVVSNMIITANFHYFAREYNIIYSTENETQWNIGEAETYPTNTGMGATRVPINTPVEKEGYIFTLLSTGGTSVVFVQNRYYLEIPSMTYGDITITATWQKKTYTVSVVSNNTEYGTVDVSEVLEVPYQTQIIKSENTISINGTVITATPNAANQIWEYVFDSWSFATNMVTSDMTITAIFTANAVGYTINFVAEGEGTVDTSRLLNIPYGTEIEIVDNRVIIDGETITATPNAVTEEFTFVFSKWVISNDSTSVIENAIITAVFTEVLNTYKITFVATPEGYGTLDKTEILEVPYGTQVFKSGNTITIDEQTVTAIPALEDVGYVYSFDGWDYDSTVSGDEIVYANFIRTPKTYSISYSVGNGTNNSSNPEIYTYSEDAQTIQIELASRDYYVCTWKVTSGNASISGTTLTINAGCYGEIKLSATWAAKTYNINYELSGGTISQTMITEYTYNESSDKSIIIYLPKKSDYYFLRYKTSLGTLTRWNQDDGTPNSYVNLKIPKKSSGDITVTAEYVRAAVAYLANGSNYDPYDTIQGAIKDVANNGIVYISPKNNEMTQTASTAFTIPEGKQVTLQPIFGSVILKKSNNQTFPIITNNGTLNIRFSNASWKLTVENSAANGQTSTLAPLIFNNGDLNIDAFYEWEVMTVPPGPDGSGVEYEYYDENMMTIQNGCGTNGGGIYSPMKQVVDDININGVNFINCRIATNNTRSSNRGGAIDANNAKLTIFECSFTGNYGVWGGAVYSENSRSVVSYSIFQNNYAVGSIHEDGSGGGSGGAIWGLVTSRYNTYTGNYASKQGGALAWVMNVYNDTFTSNSAGDDGGAIVGDPTISGTTKFVKNYAVNEGGAIDCVNGGLSISGDSDTRNIVFEGNYAMRGGAIHSNQGATIIGATFENNHTKNGGGGAFYGKAQISDSTFKDNYIVSPNYAYNGGAIWFKETSSVVNCTFDSNSSTKRGGAIYQYSLSDAYLTIDNCIMKYNSSFGGGGAVSMVKGLIKNSKFFGNESDASSISDLLSNSNGSAIYVENNSTSQVDFYSNEIYNNYSLVDNSSWGAVFVDWGASAHFSGNTFYSNYDNRPESSGYYGNFGNNVHIGGLYTCDGTNIVDSKTVPTHMTFNVIVKNGSLGRLDSISIYNNGSVISTTTKSVNFVEDVDGVVNLRIEADVTGGIFDGEDYDIYYSAMKVVIKDSSGEFVTEIIEDESPNSGGGIGIPLGDSIGQGYTIEIYAGSYDGETGYSWETV